MSIHSGDCACHPRIVGEQFVGEQFVGEQSNFTRVDRNRLIGRLLLNIIPTMCSTLYSRKRELNSIKHRISRIDPAFQPAIKNLEACTFGLVESKLSQYQSLIRAVIAQQVSTAAARTISSRLEIKCAGSITPARVGALSLKQLQSVGLTSAKVRTISELTSAAQSGDINFRKFVHMSDEEIIQELIPLFGIGRWTVEMFLIFHLGRLDVWPVDDLAVRRGWDNLHRNLEPTKPKVLQGFGEQFIGMRSVVAWYCWRAS